MARIRLRCKLILAATVIFFLLYILPVIVHRSTNKVSERNTENLPTERDYVLQQIHDNMTPNLPTPLHETDQTKVRPNIYLGDNSFIPNARRAFLKTFRGKVPMFVYPPEVDNMISSRLRDYGTWEEDMLNATGHLFLKSPDLYFIDLGCNIGVYTLFVANLGTHVVSIDPVTNNLKLLAMSLRAANLKENVTLVNNAISDSRRNASVIIPNGNVGGAFIQDGGPGTKGHSVRTIILDDLISLVKGRKVFMKIDIEGHEGKALSSGHNFFQSVDVRGILMEWVHHRYTDSGERIITVLVNSGFLPYSDSLKAEELHPDRSHRWPENVFWFKR